MKARGILFSAPMVQAILEGRKTQTRRVVAMQPADPTALPRPIAFEPGNCPWGMPGDHLWVREAWRTGRRWDKTAPRDIPWRSAVAYEADMGTAKEGAFITGKIRPGMFMPRWASRITLEITQLRAELLQDITRSAAAAEGVTTADPIDGFRALWISLHGEASWRANPVVWVVEFFKLDEGGDE